MDSANPEISVDVPPYLRVHKDSTVERIAGTQVAPPGLDLHTQGRAWDKNLGEPNSGGGFGGSVPETGVTARIYRPNFATETPPQKLPLLLYYHGGAFFISSAADPFYHNSLNSLVAEANLIIVSINYRLTPKHPLPTAYEDSWDALWWVASHATQDREDHENWIKNNVDFDRVFLGGDSAGANISHFLALRLHASHPDPIATKDFKISGLVMVNPYF